MTTFVDFHRSDFDYQNGPLGSAADILWRDNAGDNVLWFMQNNAPGSVAALPFVTPDWHVKATAEFDAITGAVFRDADILWQNDNGGLALWRMSGATVIGIHALPNPGPTWHIVGDNDFNGDTADDIVWHNDNGALALWTGIEPQTGIVSGMLAGTQTPR